MNDNQKLVHHVSDTALWAAIHRAKETERPDAQFRDPFAKRLAGERGERIAEALSIPEADSWSWMARTYLMDQFLTERARAGVEMVLNLGAGLDARPYRIPWPGSLTWIEVDLPDVLDYKQAILSSETPYCKLERIPLDLAEVETRQSLFRSLGNRHTTGLIISEGVLVYLTTRETGLLADDLAAVPTFRYWLADIMSPGLLHVLRDHTDQHFSQTAAPLQFAPENGPQFFQAFGWEAMEVRSLLKTAASLGRLPAPMQPLALVPEDPVRMGERPWAGVCLLEHS